MSQLLDALRQLAPWHFDVELLEGLRTRDGNRQRYAGRNLNNIVVIDPNELAPLLKRIYPGGLQGKTFLDVGCNSGGYSIVAKRLGAELAVGFDAREHWIRQANFLAQHLHLEGIQFIRSDLYDFNTDRHFDVCLFKGILYHLPDPVTGLRHVADMTREVIIIDTETDGTRGDLCLRPHREGHTHLMSGVHGLAWWPSGPDLIAMVLNWLGFQDTREIFWDKKNVKGRDNPGRCRIIGARSAAVLDNFDNAQFGRKYPGRCIGRSC